MCGDMEEARRLSGVPEDTKKCIKILRKKLENRRYIGFELKRGFFRSGSGGFLGENEICDRAHFFLCSFSHIKTMNFSSGHYPGEF